MRACSMPGSLTSWTNSNVPKIFAGMSSRGTGVPTIV